MERNRKIKFTKMHGLGNDFVIIDNIMKQIIFNNLPIKKAANRFIGIGFDQLLIIEPSQKADYFCHIYNADGSQAEQCGNGLRCVARYLHEHNYLESKNISIETLAGIFQIDIDSYDRIHVAIDQTNYAIQKINSQLNDFHKLIYYLELGNPHAILKVHSIDQITSEMVKTLQNNDRFRKGINLGFMEILDEHSMRLRTFERGVGETNACGSNACAAAIVAISEGFVKNPVKVHLKYGDLEIDWKGGNSKVHLIGPASRVYTGEFEV